MLEQKQERKEGQQRLLSTWFSRGRAETRTNKGVDTQEKGKKSAKLAHTRRLHELALLLRSQEAGLEFRGSRGHRG